MASEGDVQDQKVSWKGCSSGEAGYERKRKVAVQHTHTEGEQGQSCQRGASKSKARPQKGFRKEDAGQRTRKVSHFPLRFCVCATSASRPVRSISGHHAKKKLHNSNPPDRSSGRSKSRLTTSPTENAELFDLPQNTISRMFLFIEFV